jgi:hypothetical protein
LQQHAARMKQPPHERERKLALSDFEDARMQLRLYLADVGAGAKKDDRRIGELQDAVGKANLRVQEPWDDMVAGAHLAAMKAKEASPTSSQTTSTPWRPSTRRKRSRRGSGSALPTRS